MNRGAWLLFSVLIGSATLLLSSLNGCGGVNPPSKSLIHNVVIIVQENRTPDNLFQDPVLIANGADIATSGVNSKGQTIPLTSAPLADTYDVNHEHVAFVEMYDGGKMDGADQVAVYCVSAETSCPPANPQFKFVNPSDVQPYFALAEQYAFADRMFQTNEGPSFPAHQFLFSGTSAPSAGSNLFAAENPVDTSDTGCTAPAGQSVPLIDPSGAESSRSYPCYEHATLSDLLDSKQVSWRYYTPLGGFIWTAPNAIQHLCQAQTVDGQSKCTAPAWTNHVVLNQTQVLTDIAAQHLPQVSWIIPTGLESDHAAYNDGSGPSWVAQVVNAIGNSPYWPNTTILITWDDWGGWYDHVPPPQVLANCSEWGCGYVYGFRVPLIVVSPYARRGYISHVRHDFGSILKFTEDVFGLPTLGYADAYADDLTDCFDFDQAPRQFTTISTPLPAEYFLNDHRPPTDPDDD
jgi:phospholipase C